MSLTEYMVKIVPLTLDKLVRLLKEFEQESLKEARIAQRATLVELIYEICNLLSDISVSYGSELKTAYWNSEAMDCFPAGELQKILFANEQELDDGYLFGILFSFIAMHPELRKYVFPFATASPLSLVQPTDAGSDSCKDIGVLEFLNSLNMLNKDISLETVSNAKIMKYSIRVLKEHVEEVDKAVVEYRETGSLDQILTKIHKSHFLDWLILCHGDFFIMNDQFEPKEKQDDKIFQYTKFKMCKRCLEFPEFFPRSHFINDVWSQYCLMIGNTDLNVGLVEQSQSNGDLSRENEEQLRMWLDIVLEIIDHSQSIQFMEESDHLLTVLNTSVKGIHEYIKNGSDSALTEILKILSRDLKSTLTFLSILNMLSFILINELVTEDDCLSTGDDTIQYHGATGTSSSMLNGPGLISVFGFRDKMIPKIPPISKSMFQFDNNTLELYSESRNTRAQYGKLVKCLLATQLLIADVLDLYDKKYGVDVLKLDTSNSSNVPSASPYTDGIEYKKNELICDNFFIPLVSAMILVKQFKVFHDDILLVFFSGGRGCEDLFCNWGKQLSDNVLLILQRLLSCECSSDGRVLFFYNFVKFLKVKSLKSLELHPQFLGVLYDLVRISQDKNKEDLLELIQTNELIKSEVYDFLSLTINDTSLAQGAICSSVSSSSSSSTKEFQTSFTEWFSDFFEKYSETTTDKYNVVLRDYLKQLVENHEPSVSRIDEFVSHKPVPMPTKYPTFRQMTGASTTTTTTTNTTTTNTITNTNVDSGKKYILGGHNRTLNTSRVQSVHVDDYYLQ